MNENKENRYGNLLDKYLDSSKTYSNVLLSREKQKYTKEEEENRYGDLLKNAKPNTKVLDDMMRVCEVSEKIKRKQEEENYMDRLYAEERHRQQQRELEEHRNRNDALVNKYLDMKKAKEEAIEQKNKEEKERQKFYETIEKLAKINPHTAEVYIKAQTKY